MSQKGAASLPTRERGLKFKYSEPVTVETIVAPYAGAWIEIFYAWTRLGYGSCRSLRGSVD